MKYFLFWEGMLYFGFMIGDLWNVQWSAFTNIMKYIAMISCCVYAWLSAKKVQPLQLALLYSVCADYFMLFTDYVWMGIWGFFCVQICYGYAKKCLWAGVLFEGALLFLLVSGQQSSFCMIFILAFCYIVFSIWNLVKVEKNMLFVSMLLLFIGDIFVGLNQIWPVVSPAMWAFYLPSQVFVTIGLY